MKKSLTVFVTGAAGYIGSFASRSLIGAGHKVIAYDNLTTGFRESLPEKISFVEGDIRNSQLLDRIFSESKIDAVMHFAAKTVVPESIKSPVDYYDNNFVGSLTLLQSTMNAGIKKFIFSSTAAVYQSSGSGGVTEESATGPVSPYGTSKLYFENALKEVRRASNNLDYIILRYFNVAGAALDATNGQRTKGATHLIKIAAELASGKRKAIEIYGQNYPTFDGTAIRDYIHVEDLAAAHLLALDHLQSNSCAEIFNCGYGKGVSVREVLSCMEKLAGRPLEKIIAAERPGDLAQIYADSTKLKSELGWKPKYNDLEVICQSAYEWEKLQ